MSKIKFSSKFFQNKECEYFPCHNIKDVNKFNCLFCYCPLYHLKDKCGGNFKYLETKNGEVKDCSKCTLPHLSNNYDKVIDILKKTSTIN